MILKKKTHPGLFFLLPVGADRVWRIMNIVGIEDQRGRGHFSARPRGTFGVNVRDLLSADIRDWRRGPQAGGVAVGTTV